VATWREVFDRAKRQYGLATDAEDLLLVDELFRDRVNDLLAELAQVGGGFREEFTLNLPPTALVALSSRVIRIQDDTLRLDCDGDGVFEVEPKRAQEAELRLLCGVLESVPASVPQYYYTQRGGAIGEMVQLALHPRSATARAGGIKFSALTAPAPITVPSALNEALDDSEVEVTVTDGTRFEAGQTLQVDAERMLVTGISGNTLTVTRGSSGSTAAIHATGTRIEVLLPLQRAEERFLRSGICLALAEAERSRGDRGAPLELWDARWEKALKDYADLVEDGLRGETRSVQHVDVY